MILAPQSGPQRAFLECSADIAIYGGAAGGGKTFALLLEPLRALKEEPKIARGYDTVIFRRTTPQITNQGGMWDESCKIYPLVGGRPSSYRLQWRFPNGLRIRFGHLERRDTVYAWQGSQVPLICFDELTHFEEYQFWYMLSRNRSISGIPGRIRATTNPLADSWVAHLVDWYIDEDGYPLADRAGATRYMARDGDGIVWADSRQELIDLDHDPMSIMSFAFIPARIEDNPALTSKDPYYMTRLNALPYVERMQLRFGNWRVRATAGTLFRQEWFEVMEYAPENTRDVRYWDRAAGAYKPGSNGGPDWTAGVRLGRSDTGTYWVKDVVRFRGTPLQVQTWIMNTAKSDGIDVRIGLEQDPGQAGASEVDHLIRLLDGFDVRACPVFKAKIDRAKPVSAQSEHGCVKIVLGPWNREFIRELEEFPEGNNDDQVDALSGAYGMLFSERRVYCA